MPILDLQRRVAEVGRIRTGETVRTQNGTRPRALEAFRFTSPKRALIDRVAETLGGTVTDWSAPSGPQWEVFTEAAEFDVVLIPAEIGFTQWLELWTEAGCVRRCDGFTEVRGEVPRPCLCAVNNNRICSETTRLSVLLPFLADFGSWRLETHSFYAAGEMRTALDLALNIAARRGDHFAFGSLRLEQRLTKRPGEPAHRFTVPVLDVRLDPAALASPGREAVSGPTRQLPTPEAADANVEAVQAATAVDVVTFPEPRPRIDRGEVGAVPHPLPEAGTAPPDAPPVAVPSQSTPGRDEPRPEAVSFKPAEGEPPNEGDTADDRTKTIRRVFANMKELWPNLENVDREARRHALALLETVNRRGELIESFSDLTADELAHVEARLHDIKNGRMGMNPIPGGYRFSSRSGRTADIVKDNEGAWSYKVYDSPPDDNATEVF